MRLRIAIVSLLLYVSLVPEPRPVSAGSDHCTVRVSPIVFPPYQPLAAFDAQSHGMISYNCSQSHPIRIIIGPGRSGSPRARRMARAARALEYNLYLDPAGTTVWGDGSGGSEFYFNPAPPANTTVAIPVYGRIPGRQSQVAEGSYDDALNITILY